MQTETKKFEDLVIDYLSGKISDEDTAVLVEFLNSDELYRNQFHELAKTRAIAFIPAIEKDKKSNFYILKKKLKFTDLTFRNIFGYQFSRIAAIVILSVTTGISAFYLYDKFISGQQADMISETIVPFGSQAKVKLPDGTVVWLNSGSELRYDNSFGKNERKVSFSGEGYFEVTKNTNKPFMVHTNNVDIKVLGTVFNVNSYANETTVKVDLLEGKVDVSALAENGTLENKTLLPNEMLVYDKKLKKMSAGKSDAAKSAQWKTGKLTFDNVSMEKLLRNLERKYDVHFIIESKKIKSEMFTGSINLEQPLNEILEYIDVDKKFERIYDGRKVRICDKE